MKDVRFYTKDNIGQLDWPKDHSYEKKYILPLIQHGVSNYVSNVETSVGIIQLGDILLPVTINDAQYESSYVCSPYNACILYSKEEMNKIDNKVLIFFLSRLINILGGLFKSIQINKVVCINNWLLSTNLYPKMSGADIEKITKFLIRTFPNHAIMFRSLNRHSNSNVLSHMINNEYILAASRQVYIFDHKLLEYMDRKNTRLDQKLFQTTGYEIVNHNDIQQNDFSRIKQLYDKLYLDKYSRHNPQFTEEYIAHCHKNNLLTMTGLRYPDGQLDGIIGCFDRNNTTTAPLVGYDTNLPQSLGLYRLLMALIIQRADKEKLILNLSSGASSFKRLRGGQPVIEYSGIYVNHLSLRRRIVWKFVSEFLNKIGIPILKRYKL